MFRGFLDELLATTSGAFASMFLDWEGETVQLVCDRDISDHDLRIIGAYQGVFFDRLRNHCRKTKIGPPLRFLLEFKEVLILNIDVKDKYYIVMLLDADANEEAAWEQLESTRTKLLTEL